ncbi:MAG: SGNH/GDSL hydrolase family protein [Candidatus Omnitrophica bacterium]|nr:SGNH/GDSL hydrolase family protein [Candidatus Omnitrophota bacterium]
MKIIKKFLILVLYLIFIIFLMEGVTRLFLKITNNNIDVYRNFSFKREANIFMPDPVLGYKLIPNVSRNAFTSDFQVVYKTNSVGLREKELKDTDKFKIIFLGDSITFGEGVPYGSRFSDLVEKEINNVYAINAGVPGYGIHQMYLWLRDHGMNLKPNLVICFVIPPGLDRVIYTKIDNSPHLLIPEQEKHRENKINSSLNFFKNTSDRLLAKSCLYSVGKVKVKVAQMAFYLKERDRKTWNEISKNGDGGCYKITTNDQKEMVRKESGKIFIDFKNMCDRARVNFLVVNISTEPIPWLGSFLKGHNIEYLDLSGQLSKIPKITFEIDPHYNAAGNRAVADFLRDYILKRYK